MSVPGGGQAAPLGHSRAAQGVLLSPSLPLSLPVALHHPYLPCVPRPVAALCTLVEEGVVVVVVFVVGKAKVRDR